MNQSGDFAAAMVRLLSLVLAFLFSLPAAAGSPEKPKPASFDIFGYGPLGNRQLKRVVLLLHKTPPEFYEPGFIEDAAVLIMGTLRRDGFLKPRITAQVTLEDGGKFQFEWTEPTREPLPRPMRAKKVRFKIREGLLYHYQSVTFEGLETLTEKQAKRFFIETGFLVPLKHARIYTPEKLKRSLLDLQETLQRQGFRDARVEVAQLSEDARKGEVRLIVRVTQGNKFFVRSLTTAVHAESTNAQILTVQTNAIFSTAWAQELEHAIQTSYYRRGYPDTAVEVTVTNATPRGRSTDLDAIARVSPGPAVTLNAVRFEGAVHSNTNFLRGRVDLDPGEPLDRLDVERGRFRLTRLGVFDSVAVRYDLVRTNLRDVVYLLDEGKRFNVSLLAGWGSYELLRGGVETEAFNLFGRAHFARLRLTQSFKASSADFLYGMPELLGEDFDVFLTANGLRREEVSFVREEYGGGAGIRRRLRGISSDVSLRYEYEVLNATDIDADISTSGLPSARVGAVIGELQHDRRDNPLYPRKGYKVFSRFEIGSDYFGGNANYQRFDVATALHVRLYDGGWLNLGLSHGAVLSPGAREEDLPFNRRFFPGGENSIRGFPEGEASPRGDDGEIIGAESIVLGTLEFEQALTRAFSFVTFVDALGFARDLADYPASHGLISVGGGIRWKTIVGPVRVEYGHNLNPRDGDPRGAIHFSLGFPF